MGLARFVRRLRGALKVLLVAAAGYLAVGVLSPLAPGVELAEEHALPWASGLPSWPLVALLAAALVVTFVSTVLVLLLRSRKRRVVRALSAAAAAWPDAAAARAAAATGVRMTRVGGFRAHARSPHVVELSWNPPLDAVEEVLVYRSPTGFATAPEPGGDQALVCRAVEATHADAGLEDERVYHYTALARGRDGTWSSPAWAWAATPSVPLQSTILGGMRTLKQGNLDW